MYKILSSWEIWPVGKMLTFLLVFVVVGSLFDSGQASNVGLYNRPKVLENMNGEYLLSNPNPNSKNKFSTEYSSYENVEYFDVYSPLLTSRLVLPLFGKTKNIFFFRISLAWCEKNVKFFAFFSKFCWNLIR